MNPDEIRAIGKQVLADRKTEHAPLAHRFPLEFRNGRIVQDESELVGPLARQAVAFLKDGIGHEGPPAALFGEDAQDEGMFDPELWDVFDADGALAYRLWLFSDNGTVFRGDSIEIVGGMSQGGLDTRDDALSAELVAARDRVAKKQRPKASVVDDFSID